MISMQETYTIDGKTYPVESYTETPSGQKAPILDVKWMSSIKWQRMGLEDRLKRPEVYEKYVGEDVPKVIAHLEAWLLENDPEYEAWRETI